MFSYGVHIAKLISEEFLKGTFACQNKSRLRFAFEFYITSKNTIFSSWRENSSLFSLHGEKIAVE